MSGQDMKSSFITMLIFQSSRLSLVSDDTLHTPHVFPHIIENDSTAQNSPPDKLGKNEKSRSFNYKILCVWPKFDILVIKAIDLIVEMVFSLNKLY